MFSNNAIAVYEDILKAEKAMSKLQESGFAINQVSLITQNQEIEKEIHRHKDAVNDTTLLGATAGVWFGWLFGFFAGAAFIWMPGMGPMLIIGQLASTALLGGVEGVVAGTTVGSLLGTLVGRGISEQQILKYEQKLKSGKYLLMIHGNPEEITHAGDILRHTTAEEVNIHVETSA
ncbi:2-oxobutyrate oxidase [Calothrix sp. HK-06]|nr:2-oxobutyrate oxidase [Calothrix sp. HK-06]